MFFTEKKTFAILWKGRAELLLRHKYCGQKCRESYNIRGGAAAPPYRFLDESRGNN
jgi:hypothetical protein